MCLAWIGLVLCWLAVAAVGLVAYGSRHWAAATRVLALRLEQARVDERSEPAVHARYDAQELQGLPAPVQRYFRTALKDGQPIIAAATVDMAGTFNLSSSGGDQWKPFTSTQRAVTHRPGFVWDAQVRMLPGVPVRVVDSCIAGEGLLRAAIAGLFTVADARGGGELARGELIRYFAEAAWYPTALLPSQGVRWAAADDRSANATIVDGPHVLTLLFSFSDADLIDSVRAAARGAGVGKQMVMLPWECHWSDYQLRDGMLVPLKGEAAWLRPEGRSPYFHGTVTSLKYEFSKQQWAV